MPNSLDEYVKSDTQYNQSNIVTVMYIEIIHLAIFNTTKKNIQILRNE